MKGPENEKSGNFSKVKLLQLNVIHREASASSSDKDTAYIGYGIVVKSPWK